MVHDPWCDGKRTAIRCAAFALALVVMLSVPAHAQRPAVVAGRIADSSGRAIANADVQLLMAHGAPIGPIHSDTSGYFAFTVPRADTLRLLVRRIGFLPFESDVVVAQALGLTRLDVTLTATAQRLDEVVVRAATNRQALLDREMNAGRHAHFFDSTAFQRADHRSLFAIVSHLSGTTLHVGAPRGGRPRGGVAPSDALVGVGGCTATVYVDGFQVPPDQVTNWVAASEVAAIEVYDEPMFAPYPWQDARPGTCPVALIWTYVGLSRAPRRW